MGMQDILSVMVPGEVYTFEDICNELNKKGYRVSRIDTVTENLYKLQQKEEIISTSGVYIRMTGEKEFIKESSMSK